VGRKGTRRGDQTGGSTTGRQLRTTGGNKCHRIKRTQRIESKVSVPIEQPGEKTGTNRYTTQTSKTNVKAGHLGGKKKKKGAEPRKEQATENKTEKRYCMGRGTLKNLADAHEKKREVFLNLRRVPKGSGQVNAMEQTTQTRNKSPEKKPNSTQTKVADTKVCPELKKKTSRKRRKKPKN